MGCGGGGEEVVQDNSSISGSTDWAHVVPSTTMGTWEEEQGGEITVVSAVRPTECEAPGGH